MVYSLHYANYWSWQRKQAWHSIGSMQYFVPPPPPPPHHLTAKLAIISNIDLFDYNQLNTQWYFLPFLTKELNREKIAIFDELLYHHIECIFSSFRKITRHICTKTDLQLLT